MELKPYQQSVINDLKSYLEELEETSDISKAFTEFWRERAPISDELIQKQLATYKNNVPGVPNVCVKVPTAGGKTFIACNALRTLFNFIRTDTKTVLWLVPSITIEEEKANGKYIRPIVLFQAQPKNNDDSVHFQKLKEKLIEMRIPEEQIKIKTANINEIKGIDLLARDCPVRFIITIDALKEGWDCPFAYILASVADKNSSVAVEQILGRILRQPHVIKHKNDLLNIAFVMTASNKFLDTLQNIVVAMNKAGFSSKDYRYAEIQKEVGALKGEQANLSFPVTNGKTDTDLDDIIPERVIAAEPSFIERITQDAIKQASEYNINVAKEITSTNRSFFLPDEIKDKVKKIEINMTYKDRIIDIRLPRFYLKEEGGIGLFSDGEELFSKENLLNGFKLSKADTDINFDETSSEAYSVDVEKVQEDYAVKFKRLDKKIQERLEEFILSAAKDIRVRELTARMKELIGSIWPIKDSELEKYLTHIFEDFNIDKIKDCLAKEYHYKDKIKTKIDKLSSEYVKTQFLKNLDTNKIILKPDYQIPIEQFFGELFEYGITKSLYSKEFRMNDFEKLVINRIANLDNVLAWTKNPEKKGFCINGFINHYPDFIVLFKSGKLALVETKGDFLDNTDNAAKIKLGRKWADKAGDNYKYFMIFDKGSLEGAYNLEDGINILRDL